MVYNTALYLEFLLYLTLMRNETPGYFKRYLNFNLFVSVSVSVSLSVNCPRTQQHTRQCTSQSQSSALVFGREEQRIAQHTKSVIEIQASRLFSMKCDADQEPARLHKGPLDLPQIPGS